MLDAPTQIQPPAEIVPAKKLGAKVAGLYAGMDLKKNF